jgi:hypothetical protein
VDTRRGPAVPVRGPGATFRGGDRIGAKAAADPFGPGFTTTRYDGIGHAAATRRVMPRAVLIAQSCFVGAD